MIFNENIIKNLVEPSNRQKIEKAFKTAINNLTIHEKGDAKIQDFISLRKMKSFVASEKGFGTFSPLKSVQSKVVGDSKFELEFSKFLDNFPDVISHGKNFFALNFTLDYIDNEGNLRKYYPDFIVKLKSTQDYVQHYVIETKGVEEPELENKMRRLKRWCNDVNNIPGTKQKWDFLFIDYTEFQKHKSQFKSFNDLVGLFKKFK